MYVYPANNNKNKYNKNNILKNNVFVINKVEIRKFLKLKIPSIEKDVKINKK